MSAGLVRAEPKIYNDDRYFESMLRYGVPLEEARGWVGVGCVEPEVPGYTYGWHDAAYFGSGKVLLLALNNGVDPTTGETMGAPTGYLKDMKSFDEVKEAFDIQMKYWIDRMISSINTVDKVHQRNHPLPYLSLLINDCIEKGEDVSRGGAATTTPVLRWWDWARSPIPCAPLSSWYSKKR